MVAASLLSGCGGVDDGQEGQAASDGMAARGTAATASADLTVVFHMTGLLLVVPSRSGGGVTVLLPDTRKVDEHVARLGFGIEPRNDPNDPGVPLPCIKDRQFIKAGVCYVDLYEWELEEFGAGGESPSPAPGISPSVFNVSTAAGGKHKAHAAWLTNGEFRRQVVFRTGGPGKACSLAAWTYDLLDEQGNKKEDKVQRLANVLEWEIRNPDLRALVFRRRAAAGNVTVPLPQTGKVDIILAHILPEEMMDMPPNKNSRNPFLEELPDSAPHLDIYYDLLRLPGRTPMGIPQGDRRRVIPHNAHDPATNACPADITPRVEQSDQVEQSDTLVGAIEDFDAIGTVACMIATADPLP